MIFVGSTLVTVTQMGFFGGSIFIIVRKVPSNFTIFVKKNLSSLFTFSNIMDSFLRYEEPS